MPYDAVLISTMAVSLVYALLGGLLAQRLRLSCGFCERFGCEHFAKASPQPTILPKALSHPNVELRTRVHIDEGGAQARMLLRVRRDSGGVTGTTAFNSTGYAARQAL